MSESEIVGFIDVGTNSIHLLVVEFNKDSMGTAIFQDKVSVRLGSGLYKNGVLGEDEIERCVNVVSRFVEASKSLGAKEIRAYGTCACREASNSKELVERLKTVGVNINVIPGLEEARLIKLGVFGPLEPKKQTLEIDIGGGSTEIIICLRNENIYLDSLELGAIRFAYGLNIDLSQPVSNDDYDLYRRKVGLASYRSVRAVSDLKFSRAVGSAGVLNNLAEMCAYEREDDDPSYLLKNELAVLMKKLCSMSQQERLSVPRINRDRSDIIIPGGAIAEELMHLFKIDRIDISPMGMKQGMQVEYMMQSGHTNFNVRDSSVLALATRCNYDKEHAEHVQILCMNMFDALKEAGIHNMNKEMRELLAYSAILHDVGEIISYPKHHLHSQMIIENSYMLGFGYRELDIMSLIARFHHKRFPTRNNKSLKILENDVVDDVLKCAMILRIADVLDRHRNQRVTDIIFNCNNGDVCMTPISYNSDLSLEKWRLEEMSDEFKSVFKKNLKINIE